MKLRVLLTLSLLVCVTILIAQEIEKPIDLGLGQWDGSSTLVGNLYRNGNVGIGVSNPTEKLDVNGNIRLYGTDRFIGTTNSSSFFIRTNNIDRLRIAGNNGNVLLYSTGLNLPNGGNIILGVDGGHSTGANCLSIGFHKGHGHGYIDYKQNLHFRVAGEPWWCPLILQPDGNVVIGGHSSYESYIDQAHGYKLAVKGKIIAEEVVVKLHENWPDYVFSPNYTLRPLSEVEEHISNHGHLPEVPSAQQVHEDGISVGEMNAILLRKVEELTLYVIELKKEVEELKGKDF
ncbi:MAG: hypothetical protein RBR71_13675 [Gudongella sp.]|nr:hypothetical protein [Gudongella sp.]